MNHIYGKQQQIKDQILKSYNPLPTDDSSNHQKVVNDNNQQQDYKNNPEYQ